MVSIGCLIDGWMNGGISKFLIRITYTTNFNLLLLYFLNYIIIIIVIIIFFYYIYLFLFLNHIYYYCVF